jgi:glycosyltransferase involved in cell wall biosynthesis
MAARVAVLMAAYNAEQTLAQAVNSLLRGTYPCCIYIVDDASRTPVIETLGDYDRERIKLIRLDRNVGPAAARNKGLKHILRAGHEFVAIMDADDVSHPERLEKQVAFLSANPGIALVGCWERFIEEFSGDVVSYVDAPCDPRSIRNALFSNLCISHPTWLVRSEVFARVGGYVSSNYAAEDYELLRRIVARYDVACLPEYLLDYRLSSGGITLSNRTRQLVDRLWVQLGYFQPLRWRAWTGILRTFALLVLRIKRKRPGSTVPHAAMTKLVTR